MRTRGDCGAMKALTVLLNAKVYNLIDWVYLMYIYLINLVSVLF